MKLSLFDLHCDTAYAMRAQSQPLGDNNLAVSLLRASHYQRYIQVMAHWTPPELSDSDGWRALRKIYSNLKKDPDILCGNAEIHTALPLEALSPVLLLSVEDARVLDGRLQRAKKLFDMGFRIVAPFWRGESCIGGAYDTDKGLTPFGIEALTEMLRLGMILDISHASRQSAKEIFSLASEYACPVIASHSNAYACTPHPRNLTDEEISSVLRSDGVIGINLYTEFLRKENSQTATVEDIAAHIEHFLSLGAENALCLGCDLDGAPVPSEIKDLSGLPLIAEKLLQKNYSESLVRAIFFDNASGFAQKYLKK